MLEISLQETVAGHCVANAAKYRIEYRRALNFKFLKVLIMM